MNALTLDAKCPGPKTTHNFKAKITTEEQRSVLDLVFTQVSRKWTQHIKQNDSDGLRVERHPGYSDFELGNVGTYLWIVAAGRFYAEKPGGFKS
jgi:hypothetical protein